jgi:DNA invertase Pin-like site-specific DNA recombinase
MAKRKQQVRAFGYVRLSKYDGESISPTRQRDTIARLAADRGWDLVDVFEDLDVSAFKKVKRPGLDAMLGRLDETDAVITYRRPGG